MLMVTGAEQSMTFFTFQAHIQEDAFTLSLPRQFVDVFSGKRIK